MENSRGMYVGLFIDGAGIKIRELKVVSPLDEQYGYIREPLTHSEHSQERLLHLRRRLPRPELSRIAATFFADNATQFADSPRSGIDVPRLSGERSNHQIQVQ